jgi:RNA polymerase sigma-70 factor (ECF subfamily)
MDPISRRSVLDCGGEILSAEGRDDGNDSAPDSLLVRAALEGDRGAYGRLYDRFAPMVHGMLLMRVPRDVVDDLVQDVFLKAMTELSSLRDGMHFGAWLAAIARNRAVDHFRRMLTHEVPGEDEVMSAAVSEDSTARAEAHAVLSALRSLPEAYRETLAMRLVEGMTGPEIAARTGLSHDSVRVNLYRGMKLLRERLRDRSGSRSARRPTQEGASLEGPTLKRKSNHE